MPDSNQWEAPDPATRQHPRQTLRQKLALNPVLAARQSREEGERRTMTALQRTGGNPTVHTDACHARVAQQWNGDYRNLHRSPTPGCQGCSAGRGKRR